MIDFRRRLLLQQTARESGEKFAITINSGSDGKIIIPTMGRLNNRHNTYNWTIVWGNGDVQTYSGTGSSGSGITYTYGIAGTNYEVIIKPTNKEELGWLRAFGFHNISSGASTTANKAKFLSVNSALTENMIRESEYDRYVCSYMFYGCVNLTMGENFNLPQGITSVGNGFCQYMFYECTNITMNDTFNIPQGITSVGTYFCDSMFFKCTNLIMNDTFTLPQGITSVKDRFCSYMFSVCISSTISAAQFFGNLTLSQTELNKSIVFYYTFYGCTGLNEYLTPENTPMLAIEPTSSNQCFRGCSSSFLTTIPTNWK